VYLVAGRYMFYRVLQLIAAVVAAGILCAASSDDRELVVDSMVGLDVDAHVESADTREPLEDVEIVFRDIGLDDQVGGKGVEKPVGKTKVDGSYRGLFTYLWGRHYKGGKPMYADTPRRFDLVFRQAGFAPETLEFDLDKLTASPDGTYLVKVEVRPSRADN
jgi:hypothetical protein